MFRSSATLCYAAMLLACGSPPSNFIDTHDSGEAQIDATPRPIDAMPDADAWPALGMRPPPAPDAPIQMIVTTAAAGIAMPHSIAADDYFITGQAWGDYDGDGWIDLYLTNTNGSNHLYRNLGDGTFERAFAPVVDLADMHSGGATFVDFDNDGDKDLYVLNEGPNRLFRNDPTGFVDITDSAGVGDAGRGETASWGDYDGDGYVDLYVANWGCETCVANPAQPHDGNLDRLYKNHGDGTFNDVSQLLGYVGRTGLGFAAVFVDYDNDGDLDIYLANDKGVSDPDTAPIRRNVLWRNDGPTGAQWHFEEVAISVGADVRIDGMGLAVGDIDNDGDLDIVSTDSGPANLLRNLDGTFAVEILEPPTDGTYPIGWGVVLADFDNDGWLDLHMASRTGANQIFRNEQGQLVDVSRHSGAAEPGATHGLAYADYDHDGRIDLIMGNRNQSYQLYRNVSSPVNGWLTISLQGGGPVNRDAIGSRVHVTRSDGLVLMQEVKCGSSIGASNELALHFGLGAASAVAVTVTWPNGETRSLGALAANQRLTISYP